MNGGVAFDKHASAEGKTVIVTGATSGIGKEAVWEFAKRGAKVTTDYMYIKMLYDIPCGIVGQCVCR